MKYRSDPEGNKADSEADDKILEIVGTLESLWRENPTLFQKAIEGCNFALNAVEAN